MEPQKEKAKRSALEIGLETVVGAAGGAAAGATLAGLFGTYANMLSGGCGRFDTPEEVNLFWLMAVPASIGCSLLGAVYGAAGGLTNEGIDYSIPNQ